MGHCEAASAQCIMTPFHPVSAGSERLDCLQGQPSNGTRRLPFQSDFGALGEDERVLHIDAKIANGVLDLGMAEENLRRAQVARRPLGHGSLSPTHRMRAMVLASLSDGCDPFVHNPGIPARAHRLALVEATRENEALRSSARALKPIPEAAASVSGYLVQSWPTRLLLDDQSAVKSWHRCGKASTTAFGDRGRLA